MILPLVNPDGFVSSRRTRFDPGDDARRARTRTSTLVEAIAPPGGIFAYRRKNCDGEILGPQLPCELPGASTTTATTATSGAAPALEPDPTSQSYHGPRPALGARDAGGVELRPHAPGHDADVAAQRRRARAAPARACTTAAWRPTRRA